MFNLISHAHVFNLLGDMLEYVLVFFCCGQARIGHLQQSQFLELVKYFGNYQQNKPKMCCQCD